MYLINFLITIVLEKLPLESIFFRNILCTKKKTALNHRITVMIKQNDVQNSKYSMNLLIPACHNLQQPS